MKTPHHSIKAVEDLEECQRCGADVPVRQIREVGNKKLRVCKRCSQAKARDFEDTEDE